MQGGGGSAPTFNSQYVSQQQDKANVLAGVDTMRLNNVNQITPYGNLSYAETGGTHDWNGNWIPQFTATQTLSPEQKAIYDKTTGLQSGALDTAKTALGNVNSALSTPLNFDGLQEIKDQGQFRDDAYNAISARGSKSIADAENAQKVQLANGGVAAGSDAYARGLREYGEARNDLANTALLGATQLAGENINQAVGLRNQGINERLTLRNQPIQDLTALLGFGGGVTQPNFVNTPQSQVQATDVTGPAIAQYQAQLQRQQQQAQSSNALMGGLFGLGGSILGGTLAGPLGGKIGGSLFGLGGSAAGSGTQW